VRQSVLALIRRIVHQLKSEIPSDLNHDELIAELGAT
jgi:hypothetical protein